MLLLSLLFVDVGAAFVVGVAAFVGVTAVAAAVDVTAGAVVGDVAAAGSGLPERRVRTRVDGVVVAAAASGVAAAAAAEGIAVVAMAGDAFFSPITFLTGGELLLAFAVRLPAPTCVNASQII